MSTLEPVGYADGGVALTGWLARPAGTPRAAILVFPTIANFNPAVERRARMLAEAGYLAMVADFYGVAEGDWPALAKELRADVGRFMRFAKGLEVPGRGQEAGLGLGLGD